jgi:excisionase family DNA binding protein
MTRKTATKTDLADRLYTIAEIARLDAVSEKTVRRAIDAGLLKVVRVGPGGRLIRIHPTAHFAYRHGITAFGSDDQ